MKIRARIIPLVLIMALSIVFLGCGGGGGGGSSGEVQRVGIYGDPSEEYYYIVFVSGVEYWFPVYEGFKQAGNLLGVKTFYGGPTTYDLADHLDAFEQTVAKRPKGIYVPPLNPDGFKEAIDRAVDMGIAVVCNATDAPLSKRQGYVTSDNIKEGQHAARAIGQALGGRGKAMTLRNPGQLNHDIRIDVFIETMRAEFPGIQLVADSPSNQDPDRSYQAVMTVAQMHPDLGAVWMPEANSAMGASRAAVELGGGKAKILVICADVNEQILDMIQTGDMFGAINPDQGIQGFFGMLTLFMIAHPEL
ncbi:MAG: substrate-binding domain-containing protein, partial [Treponema sp.]|nr:substrate-binding domain-containing protein [Treponema sp.]